MRWALCFIRNCSDTWHIQLLVANEANVPKVLTKVVRAKECNCFPTPCARWSHKKLVLALNAGLYIILGSGQLCILRQEISRLLLNPLWLHAAYTGSPLVKTVNLHASPFHTCVNRCRDMCCATANTIRQRVEHSAARFLSNPYIQRLFHRLDLFFFWAGSGSCCGPCSKKCVQYHQYGSYSFFKCFGNFEPVC